MKPYLALYGNVALARAYCNKCKDTAFVIHGRFACCNRPTKPKITKVKRISTCVNKRKRLPLEQQAKLLTEQNYCCYWCGRSFGSLLFRRKRKPTRLRAEFDHKAPFIWSADNAESNFVAACHVCNSIKGAMIFSTLEEAQIYLLHRQEEKGYYE